MNDLRRLHPNQLLRHLACCALGCLVSLPVAALDNMPTRLDRFNTWSNGNVVSTRYAHDAAVGAIRHAQRSSVSAVATTGGVNLVKQIGINTRNGVVSATATQKIGARQIGQAFVRARGNVAFAALLLAPSIIDMLDDAGLATEDGQLLKVNPYYCAAGCYTYWVNSNPELSAGAPMLACQLYAAYLPSQQPQYGFTAQSATTSNCEIRRSDGGMLYPPLSRAPRAPDTTPYLPVTDQQVEDAIAGIQPSPEALRDLVQIGDVVPEADPAEQTAISNPQPSPNKTSTQTNPDGSTDTTVCGTIGVLEGLDIRLVEECTTTHRDPSGTVTGTTSTSSDQADPQPGPQEEEQSMFCELFPNVLACAELGDPTGDDIPRDERSVTFEPEVLFGSGSCPVDTTITVSGQTITVGQWSTWCPYLTDYVRPIVLLLAAFVAMMIVARGMPE